MFLLFIGSCYQAVWFLAAALGAMATLLTGTLHWSDAAGHSLPQTYKESEEQK
jgi:hypothetical protein